MDTLANVLAVLYAMRYWLIAIAVVCVVVLVIEGGSNPNVDELLAQDDWRDDDVD